MIDRLRLVASLALVSTTALIAGCDDDDDEPTAPIVQRTTFTATLTGAAERPTAVTTNATGSATVVLFNDSATFVVNVGTIDSVTSAHIHRGSAAEAGPIIFGFPATNPPRSITTTTALHTGTILRTSTFTAPFTFDSLRTHLLAGTSYVNVHTRRNPGGEVRGQLTRQ